MVKKTLRICSLIVTCFIALFSITACGDKAIESLEIKQGTMIYTYEKDQEVSFDGLVVIVKYNNDTQIEVKYGDEGLTVSDLSTETIGAKEVYITYNGKSIKVDVNVVKPSNVSLVKAQIDALPAISEITLEHEVAVKAARNAYDDLNNETEEEKVTNLSKLVEAEAKIAELKLAVHKLSKKAELSNYKKENAYTTDGWTTIQGYIIEANTAIDAATDIAGVDAVVVGAKTNMDKVPTKVQELATYKATNKEELENYKKQSDYSSANWTAIRGYIIIASENINNANSIEEIDNVVNSAKASIDAIKSLVQELEDYKSSKKLELTTYKTQSDYSVNSWMQIQSRILIGNEAIDAATNTAGVNDALVAAKASLDEIKTLVQELDDYKLSEKLVLATYKTQSDYSDANWIIIQGYITEANTAIDGAQDIAGVDAAVQDAKEDMDAVETLAKELVNYKISKKEYLRDYKNKDNYNDKSWEVIEACISLYSGQIDEANNKIEIDIIVDSALLEIDSVKTKIVTDVEDLIAALPTVDSITIDDKTNVQTARQAYNELSLANRELVSNYTKLLYLEEEMKKLIDLSVYKSDKKNELAEYKLETEYNEKNLEIIQGYKTGANTAINEAKSKDEIDQIIIEVYNRIDAVKEKIVTDVEELIDSLPEMDLITLNDRVSVEVARNAYETLIDSKKETVSNYIILVNAENKILELEFIEYKEGKKQELASYKLEKDYSEDNWSRIQNYITIANATIDSAEDEHMVEEAVSIAKSNIDSVITAAQELENYKLTKKSEIVSYKDEANYTSNNWAIIQSYITTANREIDCSMDKTGVDSAVEQVKANIDAVETAEEELASYKKTNKNIVSNYKTESYYNTKNWSIIQQIVTQAHINIDAATNFDEIDLIVVDAKLAMNEVHIRVVSDVEDAISNLPSPENITLNIEPVVVVARNSYNNLSEDYKALVSNLSVLEIAEAKIAELKLIEYKIAKKEELENYKQETNYSPTGWVKVQNYILEGKSAIDTAVEIEDVDQELAEAKSNIDVVPDKDHETYYRIDSWEEPINLINRENNMAIDSSEETGYYTTNSIYVVGEDNPFVFLPNITSYDTVNSKVVTGVTEYRTISKVYMKETLEAEYTELTDTIGNYVSVSEYTFSFDFTELAIGKYFKIEILPYYYQELQPQTLEFKVVDGYNVSIAKELGVMYNDDANNGLYRRAWDEFLNNHGIANPSYIKSIVLHNDITITSKDIPASFFDENGNLNDYVEIYSHSIIPGGVNNSQEFNLYGNYFNIDASAIPNVDTSKADDYVTHSSLFKINNATCANEVNCVMVQNTYAYIKDLSLIGNAIKSEDDSGFGGLIMGKFAALDVTLNNVLIREFFINAYAGAGNDYEVVGTLNLDYVKSYDAFQNMVFAWAGVEVNITNSEFRRSGGPSIIAQHLNSSENVENKIPAINMDSNTIVEAYSTGQENWFDYYNVTSLTATIKAMDTYLKEYSGGYVVEDGNNANKMNIVALLMSNGYTQSGVGAMTQGKLTIEGVEVGFANLIYADINSIFANMTMLNSLIGMTVGQYLSSVYTSGGAIFQTSTGDIAVYEDTTYTSTTITPIIGDMSTGEYLTIYQNGMAIILSYNVNKIQIPPAEDIITLISNLPAVDSITLEDKTTIEAARRKYERLLGEDKELVTNYQTLIDAENKIKELEFVAYKAEKIAELESYEEEKDDYTEENWLLVEGYIATGIAAIETAIDIDSVDAALKSAADKIAEVETIVG